MKNIKIDAKMLQEAACEYIGKQEWVRGILSNMLKAAGEGTTAGLIYERDHPEMKDREVINQLKFFLVRRGFLVNEWADKEGACLEVRWDFTPTAKEFYDLWNGNEDFLSAIKDGMESLESLENLGDIIGAGILAWMNGRESSTCDRAETYISATISPEL